jgi:trimethylamine monooxygenase
MHSHDFRDALEFKGQTVLLVGSSYSAEDLALQCIKYGAKEVVCTYRNNPMGYKWPAKISERPLLTRLAGPTAHFKDGSTKDFDTIIMCTGYMHHYPYMGEDIRMKGKNENT